VFIVPYCGLLILRRQRQVVPLIAGLIVGTAYGAVDGAFVTAPYLIPGNTVSVLGMSALVIVMVGGTIVAVRWLRRRGSELGGPPARRLVQAVVALPFVVVAAFLLRPYVQRGWRTDYYHAYAALSLHQVYWYTGFTTIALAVIAFAMLGRRCVKGEAPVWALPLLVFGWATLFYLYQPSITPHQPYASRRLVPVVLPGLILLAVWLASWLAQKSRVLHLVDVPGYLKRTPRLAVIGVCAAAIALPPLVGNFNGLAFKRTFGGEVAAVNQLCQNIPKGKSLLFIDNTLMQPMAGTIRDTCDVPVAGVQTTTPGNVMPARGNNVEPATMIAAVRAIQASGHQPLALANSMAEFAPLMKEFGNGTVRLIMDFSTDDDEHIYFGTPRNTVSETFTVYSWEPGK
jgi:hypothetical protein